MYLWKLLSRVHDRRWELVCIKQGKPRSWQAGDGDWTTETEEEEVEEAAAAAAAARDEQAAIAMAIAAGAAERWERENNGQEIGRAHV